MRWMLVCAALAALALGGCERIRHEVEVEQQRRKLAWIVLEHAEADADRALAAGDERIYGVYGFSVETPGAPPEARQRCGVKMIEGTSDFFRSQDLSERPRAYAKRYNEHLVARSRCTA